MAEASLADRIRSVFDHLGVAKAHIVVPMPADVAGFAAQHRNRIGGIVLAAPPRIEPKAFVSFGDDIMYIAPEAGMLAKTAEKIRSQLPDAKWALLCGYSAESWSELAVDRPDIAHRIVEHLSERTDADIKAGDDAAGEVAEIRYLVMGRGPVLVLTPMAFAPSQWEPVLAALAERFRVVVLSGPRLGMLALLEQRAALSDWQDMCAGLFNALDLKENDHVLEVGCGSGAIARQFVAETAGRNPLTALDISPYLLGEARNSVLSMGAHSIAFAQGSAESLPYEADVFDAAYSVTVLEECSAHKALGELKRVVRPGGRVGVIVRGIDLPQWWNMPLDPQIKAKIAVPASSKGPDGVADSTLYELAIETGFRPLRMYTYSVASESAEGPVFEFPEMHALTLLTDAEKAQYHAAKAAAEASTTLFMTRGHHCFVGEV